MKLTTAQSTTDLRYKLRQARRALPDSVQEQHSIQALDNFIQILKKQNFSDPQNIAVFLSMDGELDTSRLIEHFWQATDHKIFLPILVEDNHMVFSEYTKESQLNKNRFGIPEPVNEPIITANELDWVITPLVGFDTQGNRMGMGGGFYDRTFAFKQSTKQPYLVGWAHSCQEIAELPKEPWDIPLDALISEKEIRWFTQAVSS